MLERKKGVIREFARMDANVQEGENLEHERHEISESHESFVTFAFLSRVS